MINSPAGKILVVTAANAVSSGAVWFAKSGEQLVRAATVSTTPVYLGPYLDDAQVEVIMDAGGYSYSFDGAGLQVPEVSSAVITAVCNTYWSQASSTVMTSVVGAVTPVLQTGDYMIELYAFGGGGAGGLVLGFKQSVTGMLSALFGQIERIDSTPTLATTYQSNITDDLGIITNISNPRVTRFTGFLTVAKIGTLQLRAAQNSSNATATYIEKGSYFRLTRMN
jgi:hypothetical protein